MSDEWLDTSQAAAVLGREKRLLEAWRVRNVGPPFYRLGRMVSYRRHDLVAWQESCRVEPASSAGECSP